MTMSISALSNNRTVHSISGANFSTTSAKKASSLFDQMDPTGTGSVSRSQFARSFKSLNLPDGIKGLGANTVFSSLDTGGKGAIGKKEFSSGMMKLLSTLNAAKTSSPQAPASAPTTLNGVTL
jgi:Ca2+-binding EF-hand superfamily protein